MTPKLLFVDDSEKILRGLKRSLSDMDDDWEITFAQSGHEALALLEEQSFDVIVTDCRMPGMNGVELLETVSEQYPRMIRFMLSGQSDLDLILTAAKTTHQYLSKPCEAEVMVVAIEHALILRDQVSNDSVKEIVSRIKTLPCLPEIYNQVVDECRSPLCSTKRIGEIIQQDPSMVATILKLVNSAFFGVRRTISNPADAVLFLGLEVVKSLVLNVGVFQSLEDTVSAGFPPDHLWTHGIRTATGAARLARAEGLSSKLIDDAFGAGLLHDLGILLLSTGIPETYQQVVDAVPSSNFHCLYQMERDVLGVGHPEVGAYLLGLWGLQPELVEAVCMHHVPSIVFAGPFCPLRAVFLASTFSEGGESLESFSAIMKEECADFTHVWKEQLPGWYDVLQADS